MISISGNLIIATLLCYKAGATFYVLFSFLRYFLLLLYTGKCKEPNPLRLTDLGVSLFFGGKWKKVKFLNCEIKANKKAYRKLLVGCFGFSFLGSGYSAQIADINFWFCEKRAEKKW